MRVLVAHDVQENHIGGMNRIMRFTHAPLLSQGHEVDYFMAENVAVRNSLTRRIVFPWAVLNAAIEAFRHGRKYDIVNVHEVQSAWISLLKHHAGNPYVVVTAHGSEHRSWELALEEAKLGRDAPALRTRILNPATRLWQARLGLTHADRVFCLSEDDREYFASCMSIERSKLIRFMPGATALYTGADPLRLTRPVERIIFGGTWRKNKGIEDLVPAFSQIASKYPGIRLTVLGGGVPVESIRSRFSEAIAARVEAVNTTGDEENYKQLLQADIFLLPSLLEGTPLMLMEAMAAGLPVVTTATSGMKDVIRDGKNGILVPIREPAAIEDAIERLIGDPNLRVALGTCAQEDAKQKYSWEASSSKVLAAYEELINSDRRWLKPLVRQSDDARPLRFCFVSNFSADWNSGAAGSILAIGKALEDRGHTIQYRWKESNAFRIRHTTLNSLFVLPWSQYHEVKNVCLSSHPHVVIVSQPFAQQVFEKLAKKFPRTLFLNLTHGWEHRHDISERIFHRRDDFRGPKAIKRRMAMAARARTCKSTALAMDGLLSPSSMDGHFVRRTYGVPLEKLLLMTYGLDTSLFDELPERTGSSGLRMLFFGQYVPRKGSIFLERLLPSLGREFGSAEITFIVAPDQTGRIEAAYRDAFGDRLHIFEWMDRRKMLKICSQNDVFLFPSMLEGFGKTFLEAMACGLCVVGYGEGGLPDVAAKDVEAYYCDPGDEKTFERMLRECMANPDRARNAGRSARSKALQYTWQRTAATLEGFCVNRLAQKDEGLALLDDQLKAVH